MGKKYDDFKTDKEYEDAQSGKVNHGIVNATLLKVSHERPFLDDGKPRPISDLDKSLTKTEEELAFNNAEKKKHKVKIKSTNDTLDRIVITLSPQAHKEFADAIAEIIKRHKITFSME